MCVGVLGITDPIRLDALDTVKALHRMNIDVWMMTGMYVVLWVVLVICVCMCGE